MAAEASSFTLVTPTPFNTLLPNFAGNKIYIYLTLYREKKIKIMNACLFNVYKINE